EAEDAPRFLFGLAQGRQQQGGQNGNDRDDDEQFDEGESARRQGGLMAPRGARGPPLQVACGCWASSVHTNVVGSLKLSRFIRSVNFFYVGWKIRSLDAIMAGIMKRNARPGGAVLSLLACLLLGFGGTALAEKVWRTPVDGLWSVGTNW